jgi:hypothetical protein
MVDVGWEGSAFQTFTDDYKIRDLASIFSEWKIYMVLCASVRHFSIFPRQF